MHDVIHLMTTRHAVAQSPHLHWPFEVIDTLASTVAARPSLVSFPSSSPSSLPLLSHGKMTLPFLLLLVATALVLAAPLARGVANGTQYDLHVQVSPSVQTVLGVVSEFLQAQDVNDEIDLVAVAEPHVTLYLTEFVPGSEVEIQQKLATVVAGLPTGCSLATGDVSADGTYGMLAVDLPACLQQMSDSVVTALAPYRVLNQTLPSWVPQLQNATERAEKERLFKLYGSPNVFSQFQPHITLAFDAQNPTTHRLNSLFDSPELRHLASHPLTQDVDEIAMGTVGPHGTVLRGKDLATFRVGGGNSIAQK